MGYEEMSQYNVCLVRCTRRLVASTYDNGDLWNLNRSMEQITFARLSLQEKDSHIAVTVPIRTYAHQ